MPTMPASNALAVDLQVPTRWPALDGIRGMAVLAVVAYHALRLAVLGEGGPGSSGASPLWWPASTARFGLDAFFVLSGFLVVGSWRAERRRHRRLLPAVKAYAVRRAARILPAYWVSLIILVPLVAPHLLGAPKKLGLLVTLQQYLQPGLPSEVNVVYWSLTTEMHFYVLAPFVALLLTRFAGWKVVLGTFVVALAWQLGLRGDLPPSLVLGRLEQFALGAAAAQLVGLHGLGHRSRLVQWSQRRGVGVALWGALLALGVVQGAVLDGVALGRMSILLHPMAGLVVAAGIVRLTTTDRVSVLGAPALRLAGLVSYGVYLFHYPLLEHGLRLTGTDAGSAAAPFRVVVVVAALLVVSCTVGAASYVVVERPFLRLGRPPTTPPRSEIDLRDDAEALTRS